MAIRRRVIQEVSTPYGTIPVFQTSITNIAEVLRLKPRTSQDTNREWKVMVQCWGLPGALGKCFEQWRMDLRSSGERPTNPQGRFFNITFGQAADTCKAMSGLNEQPGSKQAYLQFVHEMLSAEWALEELGEFGEWFKINNLPEHLIAPTLKEFLEH
jgi:hypothetical protein